MTTDWKSLVGKRLLVTDATARVCRRELTVLEISPSGKSAKFRNEIEGSTFWQDVTDLVVLDILGAPDASQGAFTELPVGTKIMRGDKFLTRIPGHDGWMYVDMDQAGCLFGVTCVGHVVAVAGYWFRPNQA